MGGLAMDRSVEELRQKIVPLLKGHGVTRAGIFGSFAKGITEAGSDLDILIEFEGEKSLLDLAALRLDLEEMLERDVDVLTYGSVHPRIKERVLQEQVAIL